MPRLAPHPGPIRHLLEYGEFLARRSRRQFVQFTGDRDADRLLNDIRKHPHVFLLGVVADRQVKAERAWRIPWIATQRLRSATFSAMRRQPLRWWRRLLSGPPSLHRFPAAIAEGYVAALDKVERDYRGDAARIWRGRPSSAEVVFRLLAFPGIGPKLATMAVNILATRMGVPLADYYSVDVSADVHVRRVFGRLGLVAPQASVEQVVYLARASNPTFPGALDRPAFEVGRNWCRARAPLCISCVLAQACPSSTLSARSQHLRA